jgi:PAS domain S-box-containing protein
MLNTSDRQATPASALEFFAGGGEMGRRMRELDWSRTLLGPPRDWPQPLRTAVRMVLASRHPVCVWWGPDCALLYNDACQPLVGMDAAEALGQPAPSPWLEGSSQLALRVERDDVAFDAYYSLSLSPVPGENGGLGGVLCTFVDVSQAVQAERQLQIADTLQEIARELASESDLHTLVQKVTDAGTRLTGAAFGAFFHNTVNAEGEAFQLFTLSGAPREAFEQFGMPRATAVFKPTFDGADPIRSDDITQDPRYGLSEPHRGMPHGHLPVRSYLAVPVVSRSGQVLGGLFFGHPRRAVFDARSERNAQGVAAHAAVAIDNAQLLTGARDGERRYRELVEAIPAAIYTTDAQGHITLFNEAARVLWGRSPVVAEDRYCGAQRLYDCAGEPIELAACPMASVLEGAPAPANAELVIERPDGTRRHVLANPKPMHDAGGRVVGAVNMLLDITQRKADEAELAATKDELALQVESLTKLHGLAMRLGAMADLRSSLQAVLDTAVDAQDADFGLVWLQDRASGALVVEASRNFGEEALQYFSRVMPGPAGGAAGNAFARHCRWIIEDVENDPGFEPFRQGARTAGFRAVHSTPIVTSSGALLGVISVHFARKRSPSQRDMQVADVCARHAADAIEAFRHQEAVRESERLYRAIGESIDYGVWVSDASGRNTYVSESFLKLVGMTQEQCSGLGWTGMLHPDDRQRTTDDWKACVRDGSNWDVEHRVMGVDGKWHSILARGVPVRNDRGEIAGWAGINLDIERLKQVEAELRELDQRKNEFLATLAHELRNPLAPLRNGLEVMRLAASNAATVEKARGMMERQLAQMVRLVDDLLDVSRVSRGKIELRREDIELAAVLRSAMETSQPLAAERGHAVVADIPAGPITLHGDFTRLAQVFGNLLNNAAKYTEPGGRIEIGVTARSDHAEVWIRDNGIGIPHDMQAQVFDIFTQVDRTLEKSQGGLGIGLSIARRLVEMHGGTIRVRSDGHGRGSEFTVCLPVKGQSRVRSENAPAAPVAARGPRHRILVADDNRDTAETLAILLGAMGHEVRTAHGAREAIELAAQFRPGVVLLDIGMPRMNGYEACERMRAQPGGRDAFIVALTGWGQEEDRERSMAAGFDRHLVKPVEPAELERLIAGLPAGARGN